MASPLSLSDLLRLLRQVGLEGGSGELLDSGVESVPLGGYPIPKEPAPESAGSPLRDDFGAAPEAVISMGGLEYNRLTEMFPHENTVGKS